jgi:DNA-binding SARP family transcriptional activator/predicted RNA-binding Zn ribbon-like protein
MYFRLLGTFEVRDGPRQVVVGTRRQERCLLAVLLLEAGHLVSTERLMDLLWDGRAPASARGAVHTYVGSLRRGLAGSGLQITTGHDGYRVEAAGHRLDTVDFTDRCRDAAEATDAATRVELYDQALDLWRGPLLADIADDCLRERIGVSLRETRLAALRHRAEDQLAMGSHERVVADLTGPAEQDPTQECLVAPLMTALYREGRRAEALRFYDLTAKVLDAELAVGPGDELRALRGRILRRDPRLDRPSAPAWAVRVRDQWLPWHVGGHPALEFCNTYAGWGAPPHAGSEWLQGYPALAAWAEHAGLADEPTTSGLLRLARRTPRAAADVLDQARLLRANLYACLTGPADDGAFAVVAGFAQAAARVSVLTRDSGNGLAHWALTPEAGLRLPLYAAARAGADLLADPRRYLVCACPGPHCGWLFLDPAGRRTFCSAATCATEPQSERTDCGLAPP